MFSSRKWKFRVRHILEAVSGAKDYLTGLSFDDFRRDSKTVDAVLTKLIVIGEAAALVPAEVRR
ncbi:MAG: HepT-like ribonuclease domain-containing protein [Thermodesulfobacteriota bacterium]